MTDTILFSNNGVTTLASDITDIATTATVIDGSVFTSPTSGEYQLLTLIPPGTSAAELSISDVEIVKLTSRASSTLTITRAQEGTTNVAWTAGTVVASVMTAGIMGQFPQGLDPGGAAKGTNAVELQSARDTSDRVASATESTCVGTNNKVTGAGGVAIGRDNDAVAGVAIGSTNNSIGTNAFVGGLSNIGKSNYGVILGYANKSPQTTRTGGERSICIGTSQKNAIECGTRIGGAHFIGLPEFPYGYDNAGDVTDLSANAGQEIIIYSHPVCIGTGPAWSIGATKYHGDVVLPITPNNYSYFAFIYSTDYWTSATTDAATEPTWPTTPQDAVTDNTYINWVCMDPTEVVYLMPDYTRFIPIEVGFITDRTSGALTTNPELHFGTTTGTPTDWLNSTEFTALSGAYLREVKAVIQDAPASKILVAGMDTAATGNCTGRFFWKGILVETMES